MKNLLSLNKIGKFRTTLPVSYVACVELELVIISQQPLLNVIEIHRLAVDEDEPHASLEGRSRVLTVHGGTAWAEETHVGTVYCTNIMNLNHLASFQRMYGFPTVGMLTIVYLKCLQGFF